MGLLTIIRKTRLKEKQIRILMLGLDNAGKTTICKSILHEDIHSISPTLGFNIRTIIHRGYSLNVWDIGGQTSLRPYWRNYFEQTDCIIWVVDSSDRTRIDDCKKELHELLQQERLLGASLLVFANKQDIPSSLSVSEISLALELDSLTTSHNWTIQPCSARYTAPSSTGDGEGEGEGEGAGGNQTDPRIIEGLDWVVKEVSKRVYYGTQPELSEAPEGDEKGVTAVTAT